MSASSSTRWITGILVSAFCAISPPGLHAQASSPASTERNFDDVVMEHLHWLPAADLKRLYLDCESDSDNGRLGISGIEACSMVYVELLQRVFGGEFDALLAWSRRQTANDAEHELAAEPRGGMNGLD